MKIHFQSAVPCALLLTVALGLPALALPRPNPSRPVCKTAKKLDHTLDAELHDAVSSFNVGAVRRLLKRGADPNTDLKSDDGKLLPVLQWITARVSFGDKFEATKLGIVRAYIEAGADLERQYLSTGTPLSYAAFNGDVAILDVLVKAGANLESQTVEGFTPLMIAASRGNTDAVRALVGAGAKVNARGTANGTALITAARFSPDSVRTFGTVDSEKALHLEIARVLVAAGADISARMTDGYDAIAIADKTGLPEVAQFLRAPNAPPAAKTPVAPVLPEAEGTTPLMRLAAHKPFDATQAGVLLKAGADVNATDKLIQTALMVAAASASPDAVRFLLKNGANSAFVARDGNTALHLSVMVASSDATLEVVNQLLAAGADANFRNHDGQSALDLARAKSNQRAVDAISKVAAATKALPTPKLTAAEALVISNGGYTTLMFTATDKPFDAAKAAFIVKAGVKVNAVNDDTSSALLLACSIGTPDAVRFLIKNGAKVSYADKNGYTALMFATQMESNAAALDVEQQLIAAGADVNAQAPDGTTALALARAKNNAEVVAALLKAGAK